MTSSSILSGDGGPLERWLLLRMSLVEFVLRGVGLGYYGGARLLLR